MKHYGRIGCTILLSCSMALLASCSTNKSTSFKTEKSAQKQRYAMSFNEIKTAALKNDADAQYALGFMYYYGKQVPRDMGAAKKWIRKAANQGQPRAITAMKLMGEQVPAKQAKFAQRTAQPKKTAKPAVKIAAMKPQASFSQPQSGPQPQPNPSPKFTKTAKVKHKFIRKMKAKKPAIKIAHKSRPAKLSIEQQLMKKHDDHFTLQLLGSRNVAHIKDIVKQNHLEKDSTIYHTYFKGKDWYVLIYGDYTTPDAALAAIDRLPSSAQQLKPWVKPFASVKVGIRTKAPRHT